MTLRLFGSVAARKLSRCVVQRSSGIIVQRTLRPAALTGSSAARPLHGLSYLAKGDSSGDGSANLAVVALSVFATLSITALAYMKSGEALASTTPHHVKEDEIPESVDWAAEGEDELPESIDWEALGAVNTPRAQGWCGSCWAHGSVGAIEAIHQIVFKELLYLSVQAVIDCAYRHVGTGDELVQGGGCKGGQIEDAFEYVMKFGLTTDKMYPRRWLWGQGTCDHAGRGVATIIHGYQYTHPIGEEALMRAVARQPVVVPVDHFPNEHLYRGGLIEIEQWPPAKEYKHSHCHTVLVVGYGTDEKGRKFWKIKNSRGRRWGEKGFAYLRRGGDNKDGVGGITRYNGLYPVIVVPRKVER